MLCFNKFVKFLRPAVPSIYEIDVFQFKINNNKITITYSFCCALFLLFIAL